MIKTFKIKNSFHKHWYFQCLNRVSSLSLGLTVILILVAAFFFVDFARLSDVYCINGGIMQFTDSLVTSAIDAEIAMFIGLFIASAFICCRNFDHLFSLPKVDMINALPVTARQRLVSGTLAGLTACVIPILIVFVLSLVYSEIMMAFNPVFRNAATALCNSRFSIEICLLSVLIRLILALIVCFGLTLTAFVCCGHIFDSLFYSIFANLLLPVAALLIRFYPEVLLNYFAFVQKNDMIKTFSFLSPISRMNDISSLDYVLYMRNKSFLPGAFDILIVLAVIVLIYAVALRAYEKRRAEQVLTPVVSEKFFCAACIALAFISGTITVLQLALVNFSFEIDYAMGMGNWFIALMIGLLILLILFCLRSRKSKPAIRDILKTLAFYASGFCASLVVCLAVFALGKSGKLSYLPKREKLAYASVSIGGCAYWTELSVIKNWYNNPDDPEFKAGYGSELNFIDDDFVLDERVKRIFDESDVLQRESFFTTDEGLDVVLATNKNILEYDGRFSFKNRYGFESILTEPLDNTKSDLFFTTYFSYTMDNGFTTTFWSSCEYEQVEEYIFSKAANENIETFDYDDTVCSSW